MLISVATLTEGAEKKSPDRSAWNCYPNWGKDKSWFRPNKYREGYNKWFSVRLSGQPRTLHKNESKAISKTKCGAILPPEAASSIFSLMLCRGRIVSAIRLCPDFSTDLNAPLEDNYHRLPVAKDDFATLDGDKFFPKLDLSNAYPIEWNPNLANSFLTQFNTLLN